MRAGVTIAAAAALVAALAIGAGCGGEATLADAAVDAGAADAAGGEDGGAADCRGGDASLVRQAFVAVLGRRPASGGEAAAFAELTAAARDAGLQPERALVEALSAEPDYLDRWSDVLMDHLRVPRVGEQSPVDCYGRALRDVGVGVDDGALAAAVAASGPGQAADGAPFTLLDLLRSSLALDDVTPVLRAHPFVLVSRAIEAANVSPIVAELARRADFGQVFDAAYLGRDLDCLGCHNGTFSVTDAALPADDRSWPQPGQLEVALFGAATGVDAASVHAPLRHDGFWADPFDGQPGERPWGWDPGCGAFHPHPDDVDPTGIDAHLASLSGTRTTAYDLEAALRRGFDHLRARGLVLAADATIADPDDALAYATAASLVETIWQELVGARLTIAHHQSRNRPSRDLLAALIGTFVDSGFSLRALLAAIAATPWLDPAAPDQGCGAGPYALAAIYDPWSADDADPARRGNGAGDAVHALGARTLLRSAYAALGWPAPRAAAFPEAPAELAVCQEQLADCDAMQAACESVSFCCTAYAWQCVAPLEPGEPTPEDTQGLERAIGVFLRAGEPGFRGLDAQGLLAWEERFGRCARPTAAPDFIDELRARALAEAATLGDVVAVMKDRLTGDPGLAAAAETAALEALLGNALATPVAEVSALDDRMRTLCGVLVATPQFLLGGLVADERGDPATEPTLTAPADRRAAVCVRLDGRALGGGGAARCRGDHVIVERR